jgi:hypothetical protein
LSLGGSACASSTAQLDALLHRDIAEDVHALRVAVRHLRAVTWAFGPVLPAPVMERWKLALHDVADAASAVRDWDVFIAETLPPALALQPGDPVLVALIDVAHARRAKAHAHDDAVVALPAGAIAHALPGSAAPVGPAGRGGMAAFARGASARLAGAYAIWRAWRATARSRTSMRCGSATSACGMQSRRCPMCCPSRYRKRLRGKLVARKPNSAASSTAPWRTG